MVPEHSRIILYGAGYVGNEYYKQIKMTEYCNIVAWIDKRYKDIDNENRIEGVETIDMHEYDYIVIAVENENISEEIKKEILARGVDGERIIWRIICNV